MAFKAEELSAKVFPAVLAIACPEDTLSKGKPCPQSTHVPCPGPSNRPCPEDTRPGGGQCPEDTLTHPPRRGAAEVAGGALTLLQSQLRERLAAGL